jgi:hypothetical protein
MKNYEVTIKAWRTVVVIEAKDEEEAMEIAHNSTAFFSDWEHDETTAKVIDGDEELASAKRHANEVCEPD